MAHLRVPTTKYYTYTYIQGKTEIGACDCSSTGTSGSGTPIRLQVTGRKGKKGKKGKGGSKEACSCDEVIGIGVITAAPSPTRLWPWG